MFAWLTDLVLHIATHGFDSWSQKSTRRRRIFLWGCAVFVAATLVSCLCGGVYMTLFATKGVDRGIGAAMVIFSIGLLVWLTPVVIRTLFRPHKAE